MNRREQIKNKLSVLPAPVRKILIIVVGGTVLILGLVMIVLPGPSMLVIPLGLAILSIEFAWAGVLLRRARIMARQTAVKVGFRKPRKRAQPPGP